MAIRDVFPVKGQFLALVALAAVLVVPLEIGAQEGMPRAAVRIETRDSTLRIEVEVAATADDRATGLMDRDSLATTAGMLFLFERERDGNAGFYMYRTRFPLDIAYVGGDGRIVEIRTMPPCHATQRYQCPQYPPGVPYQMALEVNAGLFDAYGVAVSDRIQVDLPLAPGTGTP
jgi:uncharacterized membrane protein (UPF0127 family)